MSLYSYVPKSIMLLGLTLCSTEFLVFADIALDKGIEKVEVCPPLFSFCFQPYDEEGDATVPYDVYLACKKLSWDGCTGSCGSWAGVYYSATCTTSNNSVCQLSVSGSESSQKLEISCPSCDESISSESRLADKCVPYLNDENCSASIDYFKCTNPNWIACHNGTAVGTCNNQKRRETCDIGVKYNNSDHSVSGDILCKYCDCAWNQRDPENGFIYVDTNPACIDAVRDETCSIPHFKYEGLIWDWCVRGDGAATCTNNFFDTPIRCQVKASSVCITGAKSCGIINCGIGTDPYTCDASWNMPNKPLFYDYPSGCMSGSSPNPSSNSNELILPLSITGGVLLTGIVFVITTATFCLCYVHYKRQGYQSVE